MLELSVRVDDRLREVVLNASVRVLERNIVDERPGISPGEHQRDLDDVAVNYVPTLLAQSIRIDRERIDVAVTDELPSVIARIGVVQLAVGVDAILTVLELGVAKHVLGIGMTMLPDERNVLAVVLDERVLQDSPTVTARHIVLGRVTGEVVLHYPPSTISDIGVSPMASSEGGVSTTVLILAF